MFPAILNLGNKSVVIFGGGKVAERRAVKLLEAGAKVRVVSRDFTPSLRKFKNANLELVAGELNNRNIRKFMKGANFVLIATNDKNLNDVIEIESRKAGKLVNRADGVADFIIPATLDLGSAVIAISTKGKSPAVTKAIKNRIRKAVSQEDLLLIELQEFAREILKTRIKEQEKRKKMLRDIICSPEVLDFLKKRDISKAKVLVENLVKRCTR